MNDEEWTAAISGMSCFPITPFRPDGRCDLTRFRSHLDRQLPARPSAVFTGCGAGEYASLDPDERVLLATTAVEHLDGSLPVLAGWRGGSPASLHTLRSLEDAGVNGLLLLPLPAEIGADVMRTHVEDAASRTPLPLVLYLKDPAGRPPRWWCQLADDVGIAAIKDGTGDLDFVTGLLASGWPPTRVLNGSPTAEWLAPCYHALGIHGWSSALLNIAPDLAAALRRTILDGDHRSFAVFRDAILGPLRDLRRGAPSRAVSLIKAGVSNQWEDVGRTRGPIPWPDDATLTVLHRVLAAIPSTMDRAETGTAP